MRSEAMPRCSVTLPSRSLWEIPNLPGEASRRPYLEPHLRTRLSSVRRQPFGDSGLTEDFPALREALARVLSAGDAKVENARLEDILVSLVKGA